MNPNIPLASSDPQLPVERLTYEQAFSELEQIVAALESNSQSLEGSLALFERGQELVRYCINLLDQAELRVQEISTGELIDFTPES